MIVHDFDEIHLSGARASEMGMLKKSNFGVGYSYERIHDSLPYE